jgi:phasin family protein
MASKVKKLVVPAPVESASAKTESAFPSALGGYEELAALSREHLDAMLKANAALSEGFEALAKEYMGYTQATLTAAGEAAQSLLKAKTLDQVIEINAGLAKTGVEALLDRSAKLSQWSLALAKEAALPLEQCFETTLAKLTKQQTA